MDFRLVILVLIYYYAEAYFEKVGTNIDQFLNEFFDIVWISVSLNLVNYKDKTIHSVLIVRPKVWMFPIDVPDLKYAFPCHLKLKVIEGL